MARQFPSGLGWNHPYTFNATDLAISARQLGHLVELAQRSSKAAAGGAHTTEASKDDGGDGGDAIEMAPLDALQYCVAELNYGGRITDDADRRLCSTMLRDFFSTEVLAAGEKHAFSPSGLYRPPKLGSTLAETADHVRCYPLVDQVEVFGLHDNAAVAAAQRETHALFAAALALSQTAGSSSASRGRDEAAARVAADLESRVPTAFDISAARAAYPYSYLECYNTVLVQELVRYNTLTASVREGLAELRHALSGRAAMTADLEALAVACHTGKVPDTWAKRAYPSTKALATWMADLEARVTFLKTWEAKVPGLGSGLGLGIGTGIGIGRGARRFFETWVGQGASLDLTCLTRRAAPRNRGGSPAAIPSRSLRPPEPIPHRPTPRNSSHPHVCPGLWQGAPAEFWLPALFQPLAFLTATLQNYARRHTKPVDSLRFDHRVLSKFAKGGRSRPEVGAHAYGFFLEAAQWDGEPLYWDPHRLGLTQFNSPRLTSPRLNLASPHLASSRLS